MKLEGLTRARALRMRGAWLFALATTLALLTHTRSARAQANVPGIRGEWGLKSGSQMAPGAYFGLIYDYYFPNRVIDKNGRALDRIGLNQRALALFPAYVSPKPVLGGGHWGAYAAVPWANVAIDVANANVTTGWGFSDTYVQPVYLGWSLPRFDITTGFGLTAPTGRYHVGATNNTGLGMWAYAFDAGATAYIDSAKHWNVATLATFQMQSRVRSTNRRAGNVLTLQGGVGRGILKNFGNVGVVYYAQWKVSNDRNFPILRLPPFNARDRYYGLGGELTVPVTAKPLPVFLTARYFTEIENRVATEGDSFFLLLTIARPILPKVPLMPRVK